MMDDLARDVCVAARRLAATPAFTLFAVVSLAVGLSVTTAVFAVVHAVLLRGPGIHAPGEVVWLVSSARGRAQVAHVSDIDFRYLSRSQQALSGLAASLALHLPVTFSSGTELVQGEAVSGAYFSVLGIPAVLGRTLLPSDDDGDGLVVVLSHRLWLTRFSSNPRVIGQSVRIAGRQVEIVGVSPDGFEGPLRDFRSVPRFWIPLSAARAPHAPIQMMREYDADVVRLRVVGRLAAGLTVEQASEDFARNAGSLDMLGPQQTAGTGQRVPRNWAARRADQLDDEVNVLRRVGLLIIALVTLVLLVACTNLANLMLARLTCRQHEFAVRRALGASRLHLLRQQSAEAVLIAASGAIVAYAAFQLLRWLFTTDIPLSPRLILTIDPQLRPDSLLVAAVAVILSLTVFGLEPAFAATRTRLIHADLQASGGTVDPSRARRQRSLVRWQVAISSGFFIIATVCAKYTIVQARHDSGIDIGQIGLASVSGFTQGWDEPRLRQAMAQVLEELERHPAVRSAAVSTGLPFGTSSGSVGSVTLSGSRDPGQRERTASAIAVTPSIFQTLDIPILWGRGFDSSDRAGSQPVVILSARTAQEMTGRPDPVGLHVLVRTSRSRSEETIQAATVVGVARDSDVDRVFSSGWLAYVPFEQHFGDPRFGHPLVVTARADAGAAAAARAVRESIQRAEPELALEVAGSGPSMLMGPFVFLRAAGFLALGLGLLTLLLAMVGLFAVQMHVVAQRTREIGVRASLGASAAQITQLIMKEGYRPVIQGLALGLFIGMCGRALVASYLPIGSESIPIVDPWLIVIVPLPILLTAFFACYIPARRAAGVDPHVALRQL